MSPSLPWLLVAAFVSGTGWYAGRSLWEWLMSVPHRWRADWHPRLRRRFFCPRGKHREEEDHRPKDDAREKAVWWTRRTSCLDCRTTLRLQEVHREEVPAYSKAASLFSVIFDAEEEEW